MNDEQKQKVADFLAWVSQQSEDAQEKINEAIAVCPYCYSRGHTDCYANPVYD